MQTPGKIPRPGNRLKQRTGTADARGLFAAIQGAVSDFRPVPGDGKTIVASRRREYWETAVTLICCLLITLLVIIDYRSAPRIDFTLFYLLIVAFASWAGGKKAGLFMVLLSSVALFVHEVRALDGHPLDWSFSWNVGVQIAIYLFATFLISAIRNLTETLERRVKDRTAAMEFEITERQQTEEQLRKTMQQFRQLAENITDAFWMRDAGEMRMAYVSPAYEKIWGRTCRDLYQNPQLWINAVHPEDRERVAQAMRTRQTTAEFSQEYRIVRPDKSLRWIRDRAFPIRDSSNQVIRIVGIAEDITERRRLEREILEISDREQARIGQDLHDSLCQKLVSLAFDNNSLETRLKANSLPEADSARQIAAVLDDVITEARGVARGLFPVQLETHGLSVALQHLAASVNARGRVSCRLEAARDVPVRDNAMAVHLYRIAQEAVNNAIKHGDAKSIVIQLTSADDLIQLTVTDDGKGIPVSTKSGGMGLHIMDYRARTIGGALRIERGENAGTVVSCNVHQPPA